MSYIVSKWVADALGGKESGFNDQIIKMKKYPYLFDAESGEVAWTDQPASVLKVSRVVALPSNGFTVKDICNALLHTTYSKFPVVRSFKDMQLVGVISRGDLKSALLTGMCHCVHCHCTALTDPERLTELGCPAITTLPKTNKETEMLKIWSNHYQIGKVPVVMSNDAMPSPLSDAKAPDGPLLFKNTVVPIDSKVYTSDGGRERHYGYQGLVLERNSASAASPLDLSYNIDPSPIQVNPTTNLDVIVDLFRKLGAAVVFVTNHGALVSVITKKDILRHIGKY